jgi:hypothetical protein
MTEKRKFNPLFPTYIDHGGRGEADDFKMAKNVKSLVIFARDCRAYINIQDWLLFPPSWLTTISNSEPEIFCGGFLRQASTEDCRLRVREWIGLTKPGLSFQFL